jgi:hypothetical protein
LDAGAEREELRTRISRAAAAAYPWLRPERDPRTEQTSVLTLERPFDRFSSELSTLVGERARITETLSLERRRRTPGWRERLEQAETRLAKINTRIEKLNAHFQCSAQRDEHGRIGVKPLCHVHARPDHYDFAGRNLPQNYITSAGFRCPECGQLVLHTKVPIPVGAGRKELVFSCHCISVLIAPKFGRHVNREHWLSALGDTNKAGNVVLLDEHGIIYGHAVLADIAEGRQPQQAVKFFRDIELASFLAFLEVRHHEEPSVVALRGKESITSDDLERISREITLNVQDAETIQEAQERRETLGED